MSELIAQLPQNAFESISENLMCAICAAPTTNWARSCDEGHSYCGTCLKSHEIARERADGEARCPGCRGELVKDRAGNFFPDRTKNELTLEVQVGCTQGCGKTLRLDKLKEHITNECPNGVVPCPMAKLGCEHVMKRCEVQDHLKSDNHSHLAMGFLLKISETHKAQVNDLKATIEAQNTKIDTLSSTVTNLNTALASQTKSVETNTTSVSAMTTKLGTVERKLNTALEDGPHSLKQIAEQTKKRSRAGEATSARSKREKSQVDRLKDEVKELKGKNEGEASAAAAAAAAPAAASDPVDPVENGGRWEGRVFNADA